MLAKDLIKELESVEPDTDVVLWEWNKQTSESEFWILNPTLNPTNVKGRYMLTANGGKLLKRD